MYRIPFEKVTTHGDIGDAVMTGAGSSFQTQFRCEQLSTRGASLGRRAMPWEDVHRVASPVSLCSCNACKPEHCHRKASCSCKPLVLSADQRKPICGLVSRAAERAAGMLRAAFVSVDLDGT